MRHPSIGAEAWLDRSVLDAQGHAAGCVADVLLDVRSGTADWVLIRMTGLLPRHRAVPVSALREVAGALQVAASRRRLLGSPPVRPGRSLTTTEELILSGYWHRSDARLALPRTGEGP